jgi:hypothetical protein
MMEKRGKVVFEKKNRILKKGGKMMMLSGLDRKIKLKK